MKAILTKYIGCTSTRGSRIKAYDCDGHSLTIAYPFQLSGEAVYREAAERFARKMKWEGEGQLVGGALKDGYAFVFTR